MQWFMYIGMWYIMLLVLGLCATPITRKILKPFYDWGYPFAKTVALLFLTYGIFVLSTIKLIPFSQISLFVLLALFALWNYGLHTYFSPPKKNSTPTKIIIIEELVFLGAFFFWAYIRSHEPSIHGLEKFMDFGFIKSVLRSEYLPAKDMWLAGYNINYYYFGHISGAVLTALSNVPHYIGYNLILATLFALGVTQTFSLTSNIVYHCFNKNAKLTLVGGMLGSFLVNLGGNLHTIYAFTKGYPNETPQPLWELEAKYSLSHLFDIPAALKELPMSYWYPNATRFIPLTIHEFPLYSYVVADLHGHVFDIPFVLFTLAVVFTLFISKRTNEKNISVKIHQNNVKNISVKKNIDNMKNMIKKVFTSIRVEMYTYVVLIGFMTAVHYMTNAFDAPIYLLLSVVLLFFMYGLKPAFFVTSGLLAISFFLFSLPFTNYFDPFATGIGVNCAPESLVALKQFGPFIFEKGNCQISNWWMLVTLWGFFWFNFMFYSYFISKQEKISRPALFVLILFVVSTALIIIPEFLYAKDIYPSHFRANTMFKLGYQSFMMMGIASAFTFMSFKTLIKHYKIVPFLYFILFIPLFTLVALYPTFAIKSYYGADAEISLDGQKWIAGSYEEYLDIINYINLNVKGQPTILEAQGDSYTDYDVVSAFTGLPTVAGWWVHQWLWRGSSDVVGKIIPDIQTLYESTDTEATKDLLKKYSIEYVIIGSNERAKYQNLQVSKFEALGQAIYQSENGKGIIYKIAIDSE